MIGWHRLFGLGLIDLFTGSPFAVDLEKDLSRALQLLDVIILRRLPGEFAGELPDGLEDLVDHNLLTYKSLWEPLDAWAVDELIGHYVNYRKQASPRDSLLPAEQFRLYGVSTRFPQKLRDEVELTAERPGVYWVTWGIHRVRILVLSEMPDEERNALWNLFSAVPERVASGASHYHGRSGQTRSIIDELREQYGLEGITVPYTMDDFVRDYTREHLNLLPPEERIRGMSPEEILRVLPPEERLRGLSPEEVLSEVPIEEIRAYLERQGRRRKKK